MQFAMVFPGQGSQSIGMMNAFSSRVVRDTFDEASSIFGDDLWSLTMDGPSEKLNETTITQPIMLVADIAMWRHFRSHFPTPAALAGHSLGEFAALVAADVISFHDAMTLVMLRAKLMQEAPKGAMAAIIGLDNEIVRDLCQQTNGYVALANFNSIGQVVVAGTQESVVDLMQQAKTAGAKLVKQLPMSVASHCDLMQSAVAPFSKALDEIPFSDAQIPIYQNITADKTRGAQTLKEGLKSQLILPVQWVNTIVNMENAAIDCVVECGPNQILTGLNKRISKNIRAFALSNETQANQFKEAMTKES